MSTSRTRKVSRLLATALIFAALCVSLSACTQSPGGANVGDNKGKSETIIVSVDPNAPEQPQDLGKTDENMLSIGDEIEGVEVKNSELISGAIIYKITKAEMFDSAEVAGIEQSKLYLGELGSCLDESGNFKPSVKFLLIEATVQNVKAETEQNITSIGLVCKDNNSDGFFEIPLQSYFSHATPGPTSYFHYQLPVGETKNIKIGFHIDTDEYNPSDLYLTAHVANKVIKQNQSNTHLVFIKLF